MCCSLYRGRESFSAGAATEVGGASAVAGGGGMTAERKRKEKVTSLLLRFKFLIVFKSLH